MRLLKLKIKGYKNLKDIDIDFSNTDGKILLVGKNGSGKSNLLEVLSAIFSSVYNAEKNVTPPFEYDLEYKIRRKDDISSLIKASEVKVRITNCNERNEVYYSDIESNNKTNYKKLDSKNIIYLLPDHVITVYSGEEMRLWNEYYFKSYEKYNKECFKGKTINEPRMLYFNHYYWELVASILAISDIDERKNELKLLGIENISKIDMTFNKKFIEKNQNELLKRIIESLNPDKNDKITVQLDDYKKLTLICNEETLFKNMMVLLLPKNFKIITMFNILTENGIGIKELSEGEKKLLLIYGAINIAVGENLFLFDEPDSHVHESRKREIYDLICSDEKSQFIITSHSPAMSRLFKENNAFLISESNGDANIESCSMFRIINQITDGEWSLTDNALIVDNDRVLALVEGKSDVQYILKAIDIFSSKDDKYSKLKDINFLQCGGTGNIQPTLEEICKIVSPEKRVIIICDRDEAGVNALKAFNNIENLQKDNAQIFKKDCKYGFLLPKKSNCQYSDFMIEDYFSENIKKDIVNDKINKLNGNMRDLNINIVKFVKSSLEKYNFNDNDFDSFKVLLDQLMNIIEGIGPFEEVG